MTPMDRSRAFGPALWGATLAYCFQNILGLTDWFGEPNLGKLWEAMSVPYDTIEVFYFSWLFNYMGWLLPVLAAAPCRQLLPGLAQALRPTASAALRAAAVHLFQGPGRLD